MKENIIYAESTEVCVALLFCTVQTILSLVLHSEQPGHHDYRQDLLIPFNGDNLDSTLWMS